MVLAAIAISISGLTHSVRLDPYLGQLATVTATIDGVAGRFLFDTGQGLSAISPSFAAKIGCHPWGQVSGFRMSGQRLDAPHCDDIRFAAAGFETNLPAVAVLDIMKFIGADAPAVDGAIGLDAFAGKQITVIPRAVLIVETTSTLTARVTRGRELPIRLVRDVEGLALSVDAAVVTPAGMAWMELDTGNEGPLVIASHIAPLLGIGTEATETIPVAFKLANGMTVRGNAQTRALIMDGNIGAQFLNQWQLSLDLAAGRAWLTPLH
jgi:hypothetical protein